MYIKRFLEKKIKKYLNNKEILAIVGARQCGKTTLMKKIFKELENAEFITFEDRDILNLFTEDIKLFTERYVKGNDYLFIDEFQYAKKGGKNLKYIYDTEDTKIIISGSSAAELTIQSLKYLVGRILIFKLYPFSFEEFLNYKDKKLYKILKKGTYSKTIIKMINRYYEEYVIYGGYPRVILEEDREKKKEILKNIYNTYLLREIKEILQINEDQKINKIIKILALQLCGNIKYSEISNITDINFHKLKEYIEVLEKTFVGFKVRPFFRNKRKELVKSPKFYFLDNGFRNIAIKDFRDTKERPDKGGLNENFIASELTKKEIDLKYWRTKAGAEVDFIIRKTNKILPIEIKSNLKKTNITRSFRSFLNEYKPEEGYIFSKNLNNKRKVNHTKIHFRPIFAASNILKEVI